MNKRLLFICSLLLPAFVPVAVFAQHYLGVATSNYSSINSLFLNPSSISGGSEKVVVNLVGFNIGVDNNLGSFSQLSNLGGSNTNSFDISKSNSFSMLIPAIDLRLPGVMVSLNDDLKQSFAFTLRARGIMQFNHFDPHLFSSITDPNHVSSTTYNFTSNNFNWTLHTWSEMAVTYALQPFVSGPHKLAAGITLRYLGGVDYLSLKGNNLNASYTSGNDTFYASHSDLEFASNVVSSSSAEKNGVQPGDVIGNLFNSKAGSGFGMDIGVTYSYQLNPMDEFDQKDQVLDGHLLKASIAVTDIGAIKYSGADNFVLKVTGNGYVTGKGLSDNLTNWNTFRSYMVSHGFTADTGAKTSKLYMPTALVMGVDYQLHKRFYLNATFIGNLANRQNFGNSYYSQLTVTPRYDTRRLSVALPFTYSMLANDMKIGLGFRFAGFFLGSDDMMALFSTNQHGFNAYMGGYVPIYRKRPEPKFGKE